MIIITLRTFKYILIILLIIAVCFTKSCFAEVNDSQAIWAIIGEASGEGYLGMLDVASGIRARGTLKGVYGLNAPHIKNEPQWVWKLAHKAWEVSEYSPTHKGDHWGSIKYDKKWLAKMEANKKYTKVHSRGNHIFYKEGK